MRCEVLVDPEEMAQRGAAMLEAMVDAAPGAGVTPVVRKKGYRGDCELLMIYGTGHPVRRPYFFKHAKHGGAIGWDLGYWRRTDDYFMRCTLNGDHPPNYIRDEPGDRLDAAGIVLRNDYDPHGPIVLVGMGNKAANLHAGGPLVWERHALEKIKKAYPHRQVIYRPKRLTGPHLKGVPTAPSMPIEDVLRGASLVVCRHSNVGIDACIAGIPVVCEDGAASALYGSDLRHPVRPSEAERAALLRGVSYWNWKPSEAHQAWAYLLSRLSG
jgi:hypothetical protein